MEYILIKLDKNRVLSYHDIEYFINSKLKLIKYHKEFADDLDINDLIVKNYTYEKARETWLCTNREGYVIKINGERVGIIECEIQDTKDEIGLDTFYIHKIYIEPEYQHQGILKSVLTELKESYKEMAIGVSCWYNLPAHKVYQSLGFKTKSVEYIMLPSDSIQ